MSIVFSTVQYSTVSYVTETDRQIDSYVLWYVYYAYLLSTDLTVLVSN